MRSIKHLLYDQYLTFRYVLGKTKQYHSGKKKYKLQILTDLIAWQLHEGEFNKMYYAMGLHLDGSVQKEYIGRKSFLRIKNNVERKLKQKAGCEDLVYDVITKDKFYANSVFAANGLPCIENLALISRSGLIYPDGRIENLDSILKFTFPFFIKNITLEAGEGVLFCQIVNNDILVNGVQKTISDLYKILSNKKWILQKKYVSHKDLDTINSTALNSTRIFTILNDGEPEFLCAYQGFATGIATSDSWQHGSVYVGIDLKHGTLKQFGLTSVSDKRDGLLEEHPDSKVKFKDYKIPFLQEAVELCTRAHRLLYFNFIIGWDVAITDSGPLIIEANEKTGMNVAQALNGGLRGMVVAYAARIGIH